MEISTTKLVRFYQISFMSPPFLRVEVSTTKTIHGEHVLYTTVSNFELEIVAKPYTFILFLATISQSYEPSNETRWNYAQTVLE